MREKQSERAALLQPTKGQVEAALDTLANVVALETNGHDALRGRIIARLRAEAPFAARVFEERVHHWRIVGGRVDMQRFARIETLWPVLTLGLGVNAAIVLGAAFQNQERVRA